MSGFATFVQYYTRDSSKGRQEKEKASRLEGKEEVKMPVFTDDMILHLEKS